MPKKIFDELSTMQIHKLFELLKVHIYKYKKNQEILPTTKDENIIAIILEGSAQIINIDYNGNEIIIENLSKDSIFGSNFSLINSNNNQIIAKQDTKIAVINYNQLILSKNLKHYYFNVFYRNLFDIINSKFKRSNERSRILEKKQIRERLLEYFEIEYSKTRLNYILLPFTLKELADFIAVNRSAMFRELKNLKAEKLIDINGKKITLLYR